MNDALFSSKKHDWETPQDLFDELDKEFHFNLDVCATKENAKCKEFYTPERDGLKGTWPDCAHVWMNPPYGKYIKEWVWMAYQQAQRFGGPLVVGLLPARTDTRWFHDCIYGKAEIRFLKGRLKFVGAEHSAPFPSMVVIWRSGGGFLGDK